jgi:3-methyl-2-oxobutanoate hydroxymethyltransferase
MKKTTTTTIQKLKNEGQRITGLTAYDYSTAKFFDDAGIDFLLVGDSLAMVVLGYDTTTVIGMDEMSIFTKAVANGAKRALVVADMPFMSYHADLNEAIKNAGKLIRAGADSVKIEGATEHIIEVVKRCVESGIPVMGHLGFTPQSINTIGGYKVQGKSCVETKKILEQAKQLEAAGAFSVVLEMVPEESAKYITENISIPTISVGAGRYCSGQLLVSDDVLGKYDNLCPKFARRYGNLAATIKECCIQYISDVKTGKFPSIEEVFQLPEDQVKQLMSL